MKPKQANSAVRIVWKDNFNLLHSPNSTVAVTFRLRVVPTLSCRTQFCASIDIPSANFGILSGKFLGLKVLANDDDEKLIFSKKVPMIVFSIRSENVLATFILTSIILKSLRCVARKLQLTGSPTPNLQPLGIKLNYFFYCRIIFAPRPIQQLYSMLPWAS